MKRNPEDYTLRDVEEYIARIHGMTLNQILALDFPPPDYLDNDEPVWRFETVYSWLDIFHTALHVSEAAAAPEGFEKFVSTLRELMQMREQGPAPNVLIDEWELAKEFGLASGNRNAELNLAIERCQLPRHDAIGADGKRLWSAASIKRFKGGA
ncbi:MAG: hypothetical protein AB1544_11465 [Pseudomonadota bacterium]|jgi:hypothetical protein